MLVDKKLIHQAKEKLGDENAFIMADMLGLEDFDTKNLKACCPYHDEKTPSFIYNKKNYSFKCFGCSRNVDIIDVFMEQGGSFLDAAKFLFDKAGIEYSFGEQSAKTKSDYIYPNEEPLKAGLNVQEYLSKRGISDDVIDYLDIREDNNGNCVFNYYDTNDVLTMVKYRPSRTVIKGGGTPKNWCQKGSGTSPLLFNMNRINLSKPLLITEGEIDCASAIQAGFINTVSVPFGAGNFTWIEENFDWLDNFDSILIWADNDEPGMKMKKECVYRLGSWRTKYINTPQYFQTKTGRTIKIKDINDCLQLGGASFIMNLISDAKDVPIESVVDYSDVDELDISQMDGVETGIKPLDGELIKIFYGTLTILSGRPGSGKTSLIDQIIANTIDDGIPVFLFSKEMPERMSTNWFNTILAGRRNIEEREGKTGRKYHVVSADARQKMQRFYRNKLFIYKDAEPNDITSVIKSAEECVRKFGCKVIIIDNMMMLDLHCTEDNKYTAQTDLVNELIKFATKFNVAVCLVAHPRKTQDVNTDIEMYDIAGSSNIINLATRSIGVRRVSKKEKADISSKWGKYDVVVTLIKDRLLGKSGVQIGLYFDIVSRRFYTDYEEYDKKFAWDDKEYLTRLPYENEETEISPVY